MNDIMYYSELAEEYYEAACPKFAINGYEKNVLIDTDTERCIFISGDIELDEEQLLFRCKRSRGKTIINLKNNIRKAKKEEKLFPTETRKIAAEEAVAKWLEGKTVVKAICVPGKLVNLVVK